MSARQPRITISIVCSPEQLAQVQARVGALQADLRELGVAFSVATHHEPPSGTQAMTVEEAQRDPRAFLDGFVETERSVHFDPELARRQRELLEGRMPERTYRKTVQEAERELAGSPPPSPAEDALLHREMTEDHVAVSNAQIARSTALLAAAGRQLASTAEQLAAAERTRVVNVKAGAPFTVYIGRANGRYRLRRSKWHNPFRIGPDGTRDEVLAKYRAYLLSQPELLAQIGELRGQTLGCWCTPAGGFQGQLLCHGQVLAALADGLPLERAGEAG